MAGELMIPVLPCRDLDETVSFYEALGFEQIYRQRRPNAYAVVVREDIQIHLFGLDDFDPEHSTGNVLVVVPDPDGLYQAFAAGLRVRYGKLPSAGIPRLLRPRKRFGTVRWPASPTLRPSSACGPCSTKRSSLSVPVTSH